MRRGSIKNRLMDYWLGIPLLNVLATLRVARRGARRRLWPAEIRKIGVMCSPALGDALLFSAALQDLRMWCDERGGIEIVHFYMRQNKAAAELIPGADRRVLIDLTKPVESVRLMRQQEVDVLLDFTSWQRLTAFYSMMSGAKLTVGFVTAGQHRGRGYDVQVEHRADRHEVQNFRALLEAVKIPTGAEPRVVLPAVASEPLAEASDVVVFHLWASGTRSWLREWPEDRWLSVAERLAGAETVFAITGSPADLERTEPFVERMKAAGLRAVAFMGTDGFVSLAHLLARARVVVSVNTGVMHLAAIIGTPTLSINGPNRNGRWGPMGRRAVGIESPGEGCGYLHLGFDFDGRATDCMERITVEMVVEAAEKMMAVEPGLACAADAKRL
jgi:ADP-heptose:LPS heptosyltransferase